MSAPDKNAPPAPAGLTDREVRLRLIEAAARAPINHGTHNSGPAASVQATAEAWYGWVKGGTLGVPRN